MPETNDDNQTLQNPSKRRLRCQFPIPGIQAKNTECLSWCYIVLCIILGILTFIFMFGNLSYIAINTQCYCKREDGLKLKVNSYEDTVECKYYSKDSNGKWEKVKEVCYKDAYSGEVGGCERGVPPVDQQCRIRMTFYLLPIPIAALCFLCCFLSVPYFVIITFKYHHMTTKHDKNDPYDEEYNKNIEVLWPCIFGWITWPCILVGVPVLVFIFGLVILIGSPFALIAVLILLPFIIIGGLIYLIVKYCRCAPCSEITFTKTFSA